MNTKVVRASISDVAPGPIDVDGLTLDILADYDFAKSGDDISVEGCLLRDVTLITKSGNRIPLSVYDLGTRKHAAFKRAIDGVLDAIALEAAHKLPEHEWDFEFDNNY